METFQGRPIETIKIDGEEVEIVFGLYSARRLDRFRGAERSASAVRFLDFTTAVGPRPLEPEEILEPIYIHYGAAAPNDPDYLRQWALPYIHAESAWKTWQGDLRSVTLAILDTGIAMESGKPSHPDLSAGRFTCGVDAVNKHQPRDDHGHGTHVAGIAAAERNNAVGIAGIWPGEVYVAKVLDSRNRGSDETFKDGVAAAIAFAAERGTNLVINYSAYTKLDNGTMRGAVDRALAAGALLVCSAGNERGGKVRYPARYADHRDAVIAVGAVDRNGEWSVVSSQGPEITLCAPGEDILSTLPNYTVTWNSEPKSTYYDLATGTSMASPFVAAVAAMVWAQKPGAAAAQIRNHLSATAQTGAAGLPCGIIDAGKAVETPL